MKTTALILLCSVAVILLYQNSAPVSKRAEISRNIVNNMVNDKWEEARVDFSYPLKQSLTTQQMQQSWSALLVQIGEFKKITTITEREMQGYNQSVVRCEFARENFSVEITFNAEDKVIGIYLKP
jgi:hypothetical protein